MYNRRIFIDLRNGGVAERFKALVLKTSEGLNLP
jgi:hypothetical protein